MQLADCMPIPKSVYGVKAYLEKEQVGADAET